MRIIINQHLVECVKKTFTFVLFLLMFFIFGTSLSYSETVQKMIDSEAAARQLAIKAQGSYVEGSSHPPLSASEFALPILDEDSGNVLGHIIANRIRLISALNDAGLTEISSAISAVPEGTISAPRTTGTFDSVDINVQSGIKHDWKSEIIRKKINSEAAARQLAINAQGSYVEGSSHPPLSSSEFALPILDEDSGNVLGHIIANRIRLISVLNDAGLTEVSSAISAVPEGTIFAPRTTGTFAAVNINVQSGIKYDWWNDDRDNNASQLYIPVKIEVSHKKYSATLLAGYANTSVELSDGTSQSLSDILDTKLNMTYELIGTLPVHVLIGLDFNFPTGKTDFNQEELFLIMDPDLISINTFGEGFNINPTVTVVKNWGGLEAGVGIGYVWRGEYDFSEDLSNYDPGNIVNASVEMRYYFLSEWSARVFGYYAHYGKDREDGTDSAQEGDHYLFGMGVNYDHIKWVCGTTVRAVFRDMSKFQETTGGLFTEDNNSQGSEWIGDIYYTYNLDDTTALQSSFQGLYIGENDYPSDSSRFIGSRKKVTFGVGVTREFDREIKGELNIKGFIIDDAETNFPEPRESTNYKGLSAMVLVNKGF